MAGEETILVVVVLVVVAIAVIAFLELKHMRKSIRSKRARDARDLGQLPDDAHNAILTTRAIASALQRGGIRSPEVNAILKEAQTAYDRRNYRVALDLTTKAKDRLTSLKARQTAKGDLVKLESMPPGGAEEPTTKEVLQRDFPANLTQAKFTIEIASNALDRGRTSDRDVNQAEVLLAQARSRFDAQDFSGALASARQAQRSAEGKPLADIVVTEERPSDIAVQLACPSCGAPLAPDDLFCRKCGTRVGAEACGSCGSPVSSDDTFCRKCGASLAG